MPSESEEIMEIALRRASEKISLHAGPDEAGEPDDVLNDLMAESAKEYYSCKLSRALAEKAEVERAVRILVELIEAKADEKPGGYNVRFFVQAGSEVDKIVERYGV